MKKPFQILFMKQNIRAFSLLEMSLVIAIVALIISMSAQSMKNVTKTAEISATKSEMKQIQKALQAYWDLNGRLPCPAISGTATSSASYGVEAANPGTCTGTRLNNGSEGMIPFKTLNLPDTFAEDAWSTRYTYAVNLQLTRNQTSTTKMVKWPKRSNTAPQDVSYSYCYELTAMKIGYSSTDMATADKYISRNAAYAIVSHGANGYGGVLKSGTRAATTGANADELVNADAGGFSPTFVQRTPEPGGYDDIVMYKDLWNLSDEDDKDQLTKNARVLYFTAGDGDHFYTYEWTGSAFAKRLNPRYFDNNMSGLTASGGNSCYSHVFVGNGDFPVDENVGIIYNNSSLYISSAIPLGANNFYDADFAPNHDFIVFATEVGPKLRTINQFNYMDRAIGGVTTDKTYSVAFSPNGTYLATATDSSTDADRVVIYIRSGATYTRVGSGQLNVFPTTTPKKVAFSPDGKYLAVAHNSAGGTSVMIYSVNYDANTFTRIATTMKQPGGNATSVSFSANSRFLAVGHSTAPYLTVYSMDSNLSPLTLTKLDIPDTAPSGPVNSVSFSNAELFLAVAVNAAAAKPAAMVYEIRNSKDVVKLDDLPGGPTGVAGYAAEFVPY